MKGALAKVKDGQEGLILETVQGGVTEEEIADVYTTLERFKSIETLIWNFYPEGLMIGFLSKLIGNTSINHIRLTNGNMSDGLMDTLAKLVTGSGQIRRLGLKCNSISDESVPLITSMIVNSSLEQLDLGYNILTTEGMNKICRALSENHENLVDLNLSGCPLSLEAVGCIAGFMKKLQKLWLMDCDIDWLKCKILVQHIPASSLTHIVLSRNNLGTRSLQAFSKMLVEHKDTLTLRELNLNHNKGFNRSSLIGFGKAVGQYPRLEKLTLGFIGNLDVELVESWLASLRCHPSMRNLHIYDFSRYYAGYRKLVKYVEGLQSPKSKILVSMMCAREYERIGYRSGFSKLPVELIKSLHEFIE